MPNAVTNVLFIQGGGQDAHDWDARLAHSLEEQLGRGYWVAFPRMPNEADPSYPAWRRQIREELQALGDGTVLVAHSIGASMVVKMLAEDALEQSLRGVFLIAAPFVGAGGWDWKEAELPEHASERLPKDTPLFLYHGCEDDEVPFAHLELYMKAFPQARGRALTGRNHQLNDDLTDVAEDIRKLTLGSDA